MKILLAEPREGPTGGRAERLGGRAEISLALRSRVEERALPHTIVIPFENRGRRLYMHIHSIGVLSLLSLSLSLSLPPQRPVREARDRLEKPAQKAPETG